MAINNNSDPMLTVKEVSTLLHIHPNTLRRWADKGLIKSFCITPRGDRRFKSRDIEEFLSWMNSQSQGRAVEMPLEPNTLGSQDLHQVSSPEE
jgi:excisionase family DNA binding protein